MNISFLICAVGKEGVDAEDYSKPLELEAAKPNGDSSTGIPCEPEMRTSGKISDEQCIPSVLEGVVVDVNEIAEGRGGSKVEVTYSQNGNGMTMTTDATQVSDGAAPDTVSTQVIANDFDSILVLNENVNDSNLHETNNRNV